MALLDELHKKILACTECPLHQGRKQAVPGEGRSDADIMFVGEGPGAEEDEQGRPFVGRSGQLLNQMLSQVGFDRNQVFIGNIVKCRPPENRNPNPDEAAACRHWLQAQIALIRPKVIVLLGRVSLEAFFGTRYALGRVIGQFIRFQGQLFFVTWHPSYILRAQKNKSEYLKHFKKLRSLADKNFELPEG
ncbi:MAG: uracil-DNA glycosylase [bacterium]